MVSENKPRVLSCSSLVGDAIVNPAGEKLGTLEEIMFDLISGRIAYAVLSFGGIFGIGDKLFAIPWRSLMVDTENRQLILDASKEMLEKAPGFDKNNWPDMADEKFGTEIYSYYKQEPYWREPVGRVQVPPVERREPNQASDLGRDDADLL